MDGETLNQLEREVRCQDEWSEDPSSSHLCVVEVVVSGVVGSDDEGSWRGQFDDAEESDTSIV